LTSEENGKLARLSINNDGDLIPHDDLDHIYERSFKSEKVRNYRTSFGLGLSMVKHVAMLHQGQVWTTSNEATGTTGFFELPAID
jgi:signal transduction histidine kinase